MKQNKGYYAVQSYWRSPMLPVPIEKQYATSYKWLPVIVTDILCRTVLKLSQIDV